MFAESFCFAVSRNIIVDGVHEMTQMFNEGSLRSTCYHLSAIAAIFNRRPFVAIKTIHIKAKQIIIILVSWVIIPIISLTKIDPINSHIVANNHWQIILIDAD